MPDALSMPSSRRFTIFLACYFVASVAFRLLRSDSFELDETEQILWAQVWLPGYSSQPPAYPYAVMLVFALFGESVFSLVLLKYALVITSLFLYYRLAFVVFRKATVAEAAALSLLLMPEVLWETQVDRANSVMTLTLVVAGLYAFLFLLRDRRMGNYMVFGFIAGLGVLCKYNFVLFLGALLAASLFFRDGRRAVLCRSMFLLVLPVAAVIVLPHALWFLQNTATATGTTVGKFRVATGGRMVGVLRGIASLIGESIAFVTPMWIVLFALTGAFKPVFTRNLFSRSYRRRFDFSAPFFDKGGDLDKRALAGLLELFYAIVYSVLLLLVIGFGLTHFIGRWFIVFLFSVPLYILLKADLDERRERRLRGGFPIVVALVILVFAGLFARNYFPDAFGHYARLTYPFHALAEKMKAEGVDRNRLLLAESQLMAGNLKVHLDAALAVTPDLQVVLREYENGRRKKPYRGALLVWQNGQSRERLLDVAERMGFTAASGGEVHETEVLYRNSRVKKYKVFWQLFPKGPVEKPRH